jgi:hypothetical protein
MTRSFYGSVIGAAVLLAASAFTQVSHAQDSGWNNGFGPRNYGYSGNAYTQSYSNSAGFGYSNNYVTGYKPYYYGVNPYYGVYPYYAYSGVGLGVYPNGFYSYSVTPYYGGYYPAYGNYAPSGNYGMNSRAAAVRANAIRNQNIRNAAKARARAW